MNARAVEITRADAETALAGRADQLEPLRKSTLVVTGGTGFLGTWLTEVVTSLNDRLRFDTKLILVSRSIDRFKLACPHLADRADVALVKSDIRYLSELPKETAWVIHAAANPDNRFHSTNPIETMAVIADGTTAVLRAADRCSNLKMLLNISSALVYGAQPWELARVPETFAGAPECGSVSSVYGEAKRYAETMGSAARSQARIPVVTARPFAFLGPYQALDTPWAINNFLRDSLAAQPIRVLGDGQTVRSYLHGADAAVWLLRMLTAAEPGQVFNLGSPEGVSLEALAQLISAQFNPRPEVRLFAGGSGQIQKSRLVPDTSRAREALGLAVTMPLENAVARTVAWHRAAG